MYSFISLNAGKSRAIYNYDEANDGKIRPIYEVLANLKGKSKGKRKAPSTVASSMLKLFGRKRITRNADKIVVPGGTAAKEVITT